MRKQVNLRQRKVTFLKIFSHFCRLTVVYLVYLSQNSKNVLNYQGDFSASFFPINRLNSQRNFCSQSCTNILGVLTKNSPPQGKIESLRLSDILNLSLKQTKLQTVAADECYYYCYYY